jgi:hypothetical protein
MGTLDPGVVIFLFKNIDDNFSYKNVTNSKGESTINLY